MSTSRRVANPIAVRRFTVVDEPGREIVLTIGKPRPDPRSEGRDWMCSVLIEGIPKARRRRIRGVDALQALQLATRYARRELDASGLALTWLEEGEPGNLGLPLAVPDCYGVHFQHRIERYVEEQVLEIGSAVTVVLQERARRRARADRS